MAEGCSTGSQPLTIVPGTAETMTEAILPGNLVLSLLQSQEEFPVDFDTAWQWIGYTRKDTAKDALLNAGFLENLDYQVLRLKPGSDNHAGFSPQEKAASVRKENIWLTVDCFKSLAMMAGTSRGREVRKYFLNCERQLKQLLNKPVAISEPPQSPALPEYKQKRLDAKVTILQSFQQFQANSNLPFSRAAMHFCIRVYPQDIPDWVVELHPTISWQSLARWHSIVKKNGQQALTDGYGKRKTILQTNPEFNAHFTQILTQNPQIPGTELHRTLSQITPQCPSLPSIQRLKREWLSQQTAIALT